VQQLVALANQSGEVIRHYIGFEISGQIHLGTGIMTALTIKQLQEALQRARQLLVSNTQGSDQTNNQNSPNTSNNNSSSDRCTELRNSQWTLGEQSQRVRELQDCMTQAGFFNWPYGSTGYFGPVTQKP